MERFSTLLSSRDLGHMRKLRFNITVPADVAAFLPASGVLKGFLIYYVSLRKIWSNQM